MYKDIDWSTDKMTTTGGVGVGAGRFMAYSPSPSAPHSPHISALRSSAASSALVAEQEKYLSELLAERHKITPFLPVLPNTYRLLNQGIRNGCNYGKWLSIYGVCNVDTCTWKLNLISGGVDGFAFNKMDGKYLRKRSSNIQSGLGIFGLLVVQVIYHLGTSLASQEADEILRVTTLLGNASVLGQSGLEHASPLASGGTFSNGAADANGWASRFQSEMTGILHPSSAQNWLSSQGSSSGLIVKRTIRVDIPVDKYPNYNFVGRLLGPRGNSLKRVEASTECRVLIRGRGSIKDPAREDMMRGKPGYEHLNEPLHILVEGELPVEIVDARLMQAREILEDLLKPVDESQDYYKKQQLRELAMLNGTFREEGSPMSGSVSPFNNSLAVLTARVIPVSANAPDCDRGTGTVCASSNLFLLYEEVWNPKTAIVLN
ncbi:hypothetical protein OIU85_002916 [Salix viminalis]|uniref:K Homology domain-containing protein n=1 Tax=Salix viminalis TaxID=40686 RepID=A0A9Q0ZZL8_SALVM|nr:hypothetical protein OIU85_002916 [Salix viminalis]